MAQKHVVVKKKVRKKVAKKGPDAAPSPSQLPPRQRTRSPSLPPRPAEGFGFNDIVTLLLGIASVALVVLIFAPIDLSKVDGYPYDPSAAGAEGRNLLAEAEKLLITGTGDLAFTEAELNTYLNQRLKPTQRGPLSMISEIKGVYVDVQANSATLYLVQRFFGYPLVIRTNWDYYLADQKYVRECTGSGIGHLSIKGLLFRPIMMPFLRLAKTCWREVGFLDRETVERVQLEPGVLKLKFGSTPS